MITMKLKNHTACNCRIEIERGIIHFISYQTEVARAIPVADFEDLECTLVVPEDLNDINNDLCYVIEPKGQFYYPERVYSQATARQISYFLREYFNAIDYPTFKKAALMDNKYIVARLTREVIW